MYFEQIFIGTLALINVFAFFVVVSDKRKSTHYGNVKRIPEGLIFFMATIFGGVGVYAGMLIFRHKTKKWYFQIGIPLLILQNLATLYLLKEMFIL